jgi:glucose-1-phosphate adenylyltransferase
MKQNSMLAMILAGGRGSRLHDLTNKVAKPAVSYGGKYRIIDFPLSNCANSGIDVVGVLTQYESVELNSYVAAGGRWGLDSKDSGVYVLPPREKADTGLDVYRGTADAISQNIDFIDQYDPEYLLVLSGDHIYKMNYDKMLAFHKERQADATIAVIEVPLKEASRFGIMNTDGETDRITEFVEKPPVPESNLASMGIYIFNWKLLRKLLLADMKNPDSNHDFGKDIIPKLLGEGKRLYSYEFHGFWKDVGTIASFHETSMDLLGNNPEFDLFDKHFPIMSNITTRPPHYIGPDGRLDDCLVSNGCKIYGTARHSILSTDVIIEERAVVEDSVLLPGAHVKSGAHICRAILGENSTVEEGVKLGSVDTTKDTAVVGNDVVIGKGE